MLTTAIICSDCRRVVAVGATMPATCFGAVPLDELGKLSAADLDNHPKAHHHCVEFPVLVPDDALGGDVLAEVARSYAEQIASLADLVLKLTPEDGTGGPPG